MIEIDGSQGEGGGQVLRTSLSLSLVHGKPIRVTKIRASREKPGLRAQHLAAVNAAATIGNAELSGAELGSQEIRFHPKAIVPADYRIDVGTAGSTSLVLQTVLPALLMAKVPSSLVLDGGTHNPLAPPFEFLARVFLPLMNRLGAKVEAKLDRAGFYPAGGGKIRVTVEPPAKWNRLELMERGEIVKRRAMAAVVDLPLHIVERELKVVKLGLGWKKSELRTGDLTPARGPGNVVELEIESENVTEMISGVGAKGVRAERVAETCVEEAKTYLESHAPVGAHLADQLMVPLALAGGGSYRTLPLTEHAKTQIGLLKIFGVT
ncbi:MAG TPA: RNA 3'-terminal phosphate cyclase, partial [bacterium]|nr:RNA 3'-terminal phosphate cyclase [bacterium]